MKSKSTLVFVAVFALFFALFGISTANGQGCVAVRPMGSCSGGGASGNNTINLQKGQFQVSGNYRFFRSYKHFRGEHEEKERVELGTEVINLSNTLEIGLGYGITDRLSAVVNLPLIHYDRSSLYEHYGNSTTANPEQKRFHTGAQGIGDLRLAASYWLWNPQATPKGNVAVGLGVKLPTGKYDVTDEFHKRKTSDGTDTVVIKPVDQSIQLGDGGVGFSLELQAYQQVFKNGAVYLNGFYMFNPKETNGVLRSGDPKNPGNPITSSFSVADQFAARLGLNYVFVPALNFAANLGVRAEGIPAHDAIGGSEGFRRPGYIVSAEPGLSMLIGNTSFNLNVPIAVYRNRVKSVSDLADPTGKAHGDAAFADYLISVGVAHRFGKKSHDMAPMPTFKDVQKN